MTRFDDYLSPFTWRYGSQAMRTLWSEKHKRRTWRQIWAALAAVEAEFGLVASGQLADIQEHVDDVDVERALEIEADIHHDLMAELRTFAGQCAIGGGMLHLGATSADIEDNADALRIRQSLKIIRSRLKELLLILADAIDRWADLPVIGITHLQPAEPTTLGYRLAVYAQDWLATWEELDRLEIRGKGFKGPVGSAAAFVQLVGADHFDTFEAKLSDRLGMPFYPVASQVYPRIQDYRVISALAALSAGLYKFAFDLRLEQSPFLGEWAEPFGTRQVGSSAMPFKKNPIQAEKIDSLGRFLAGQPRLAWDNAAHSLFERTLDDSANRRILLPESFLAADELLSTAIKVLTGLAVDESSVRRNLDRFAGFSAIEPVLIALTHAGGDRQILHENLRQKAMRAWEAVQQGQPNPIKDLIREDPALGKLVSPSELTRLLDEELLPGIAPGRAREMAQRIRSAFHSGGQDPS